MIKVQYKSNVLASLFFQMYVESDTFSSSRYPKVKFPDQNQIPGNQKGFKSERLDLPEAAILLPPTVVISCAGLSSIGMEAPSFREKSIEANDAQT